MDPTIKDLVIALETMEKYISLDMMYHDDDSETYYYSDDDDDLTDRAIGLACELLILPTGECNLFNIGALEAYGYSVYPGDQDSYGWLTGCIEKNNRVLVFG